VTEPYNCRPAVDQAGKGKSPMISRWTDIENRRVFERLRKYFSMISITSLR